MGNVMENIINDDDYVDKVLIDCELKKLYEDHFKIDVMDRSMKIFTREEQVERYAKNLAFWINLSNKYRQELIDNGKDEDFLKQDLKLNMMCKKGNDIYHQTVINYSDDSTMMKDIMTRLQELED